MQCGCSFRCEEQLDLIKHCFDTHSSFEPAFCLVCGIKGCLHQFRFGSTFSSFKTHATRKHPNWRNEITTRQVNSIPNDVRDDSETSLSLSVALLCPDEHPSSVDEYPSLVDECSGSDARVTKVRSVEETAALFILTLKKRYKLTQSALNFALGSVNEIISGVCNSIEQTLLLSIDKSALDLEISSICQYNDPFRSLKSEYLQSKFYRERFGLVVSSTIQY